MTKTGLFLCVLLAGCAATPPKYTLVNAEADCVAKNAPFSLFSGCIETQMRDNAPAWQLEDDADLLNVYLSWLNAAGARVARGELDETAAKLKAADLKAQIISLSKERRSAARQQALNTTLAGFAILNAAPRPGPAITCRTVPTGLGTTMTTCQ
jgi:hypothetical protein